MRNDDTHFRVAKNSEQPARCEAMVTLLHRTTMEDCLAAPVKTQTFHHVITPITLSDVNRTDLKTVHTETSI